ncbi:ABC transporter ATP-binding protein [Nitrospirillum amazonense]|uniref:ABC transporter ATP-binding protein n=1 Tax=Nitrospirillum amazonense TaxID=28077 RepID=UPI00241262EC|nr:ABC transporter ATP-binding protein [Nitrospirillum amazonense]MDG3439848.1 ABC transporter ATP-binding protein [Nitrospirillum amazonense]
MTLCTFDGAVGAKIRESHRLANALPPPAVEVRHLSKRYGGAGRGGMIYDLLAGRRGRAEPTGFWALDDLSFTVPQGGVLGIVGRNGSGKTTLMRILSRITAPTKGEAVVRGRVGALLEIGSGFHPELTGRENIDFSGAILGMTQAEAREVVDAIIDFAEIADFLNTPVKHYSIGMYMRLAFAVSSHIRNEVLLLDEILAVGDERFQDKCRRRIKQLCGEGRTVLIISHTSALLEESCDSLLVLDQGRKVFLGDPYTGIDFYHRDILRLAPGARLGADGRPYRAAIDVGRIRAWRRG